jgi:hypothetical protein
MAAAVVAVTLLFSEEVKDRSWVLVRSRSTFCKAFCACHVDST